MRTTGHEAGPLVLPRGAGTQKVMENSVRHYVRRILLLHLAILVLVVATMWLAGQVLYVSAQREAESQALERLSAPANRTRDALERYFNGLFETTQLAEQMTPLAPRLTLPRRQGEDGVEARLAEALWVQLRGRLSDLLVLDVPSFEVRQQLGNPTDPWRALRTLSAEGQGEIGDEGALLVPTTLRSALPEQDSSQVLVERLRPWLEGLVEQEAGGLSAPLNPGLADVAVDRPVLVVAAPLRAAGESRVVRMALGVIPLEALEQEYLLDEGPREPTALVVFDAEGRLVAGGPSADVGRPIEALAPDLVPWEWATYVRNSIEGQRDPRRLFDGRFEMGGLEAQSVLTVVRHVRVQDRPATREADVPEPAAAVQQRTPDARAGVNAADAGESGAGQSRLWLVVVLDRDAVVAPLEQTVRTATLWAGMLFLGIAGILASTAIQLIVGRNRLERLRGEMIEKELREARQIQLSWLPDEDNCTPSSPCEIEVAAQNVPASHISGDFYNYFELPDGRFALVIGDVTGHGMAAAFLMATTQLLVRATLQRLRDPGKTLDEVNKLLCGQAFHGQFVTALLAVVEPDEQTLQVASAGHPSPLTCRYLPPGERAGGDGVAQSPRAVWEQLDVEAQIVLGVLPEAIYPTQTVRLRSCDALLLFTDGLVEAQSPEGKRLEVPGLCEAMARRLPEGAGSARELAAAALGLVQEWSGGSQVADDLTLLAVRFSGRAARREGDGRDEQGARQRRTAVGAVPVSRHPS